MIPIALIICSSLGVLAVLKPKTEIGNKLEVKPTSRIQFSDLEMMTGRADSQEVMASNPTKYRSLMLARATYARKVYELNGALNESGPWLYEVSRILAVSPKLDDCILGHEIAILALSKGEKRAALLAIKSEDRMLTMMGRPQRFGFVPSAPKDEVVSPSHVKSLVGDTPAKMEIQAHVAAAEKRVVSGEAVSGSNNPVNAYASVPVND